MGLRTRLVLASTAGVVSGVLTLWIALAVGGGPLPDLGAWAAAGLGIGVAISAGLVLHLTRVPMRTIASVREGLARAAAGQVASAVPAAGAGTADLAREFNEAAHALELRLRTIRQSHAQLETVLSAMADGVVIVDEEEAVALMNPAAGSLLGIDAQDAPGRSLPDALRDHELVGVCQRARSVGETVSESLAVGPLGRSIQAVATPIRLGDVRHIVLMMHDLTEVRATAAARRDFVANVSHELRTPVTSLRALVDSLQAGAADDPELRTDFLRRIDGEIDRLAAMIAELLDLAAAEADRASHQFERVNLGDLVRQSAERLRPQAERGGVGLAIESPRAVLTVSADPAQTDRMVVNLLHNAIKFTPPGGQVRVSVQVEDGEAVVRVHDTGVGIDAEELPRVFERFYKVDPSRASEGSGLGLAIAKHTALLHGGRIWAESDGPERGSVFSVALPVAAEN